jgi:hypothetical protein
LGESIDEERNQESRPEEKGCPEEKGEVAFAAPPDGAKIQANQKGPAPRGLFHFAAFL